MCVRVRERERVGADARERERVCVWVSVCLTWCAWREGLFMRCVYVNV